LWRRINVERVKIRENTGCQTGGWGGLALKAIFTNRQLLAKPWFVKCGAYGGRKLPNGQTQNHVHKAKRTLAQRTKVQTSVCPTTPLVTTTPNNK